MFLTLLLCIPVVFAALVFFIREQKWYAIIVRTGAFLVIAMSAAFVITHYGSGLAVGLEGLEWTTGAMLVISGIIAAYLLRVAFKRKSLLLGVMAAAQFGASLFYEMRYSVMESISVVLIDKLSLLMILLVGVISGLICIYAVEYMKDYHRHHPEVDDRRGMFFSILFLFISAMYGIVICDDMPTALFFWEITSLCSFILIGYTKKPDAVKNSMTAIKINVFGGLCFSLGLIALAQNEGARDFSVLLNLEYTSPAITLAVFLIACAGLTKSAQFPFSKWLTGAMVAPTPTSALFHSATMVKAGVYLIIRLSPMLGNNTAGIVITLVGGITFLTGAVLAMGRIDAKRLLAYSTISNLGLIVACAGLDSAESLWAAMMLIVFHAIAKSLLFLAVGSTEHQLGSREIEDMDGLYQISRTLTFMLIIGIVGMFLAPFGMLISKWAAMKAFIDSRNVIIVLILCYGSSITLFFWAKWLGKLIENANRQPPTSYKMRNDERVSMFSLAFLVIAVCAAHPIVSAVFIEPFISSSMGMKYVSPIGSTSTTVIIVMMCLLFISPVILLPLYRSHKIKKASVYLSGQNTGDDVSFYGSMGEVRQVTYRNWYLRRMIREVPFFRAACFICATIMILGLLIALGGVLL